jgi:hypothetical protein
MGAGTKPDSLVAGAFSSYPDYGDAALNCPWRRIVAASIPAAVMAGLRPGHPRLSCLDGRRYEAG